MEDSNQGFLFNFNLLSSLQGRNSNASVTVESQKSLYKFNDTR